MSRESEWDAKGMTPEKVRDLYAKAKTLHGGAKLAGVSRKTFWMWVHKAGITPPRGRRPDYPRRQFSCLAEWIRDHPSTPLPIAPAKIVALTGCTIDSVKSYLKRRRHELDDWVRGLPDLRLVKGVSLLTTEGYAVPLIAIDKYAISTPRLKVRITGTLKSGRHFTVSTTQSSLVAKVFGTGGGTKDPT